jgi:hypothetical protein
MGFCRSRRGRSPLHSPHTPTVTTGRGAQRARAPAPHLFSSLSLCVTLFSSYLLSHAMCMVCHSRVRLLQIATSTNFTPLFFSRQVDINFQKWQDQVGGRWVIAPPYLKENSYHHLRAQCKMCRTMLCFGGGLKSINYSITTPKIHILKLVECLYVATAFKICSPTHYSHM